MEHVFFSGAETPPVASVPMPKSRPRAKGVPGRTADGPVDPLAEWLLQQAGIDAHAYRRDSLRRRVPACLRQLRTSSPGSARALLERKPQLIADALSSVLIGVTDFFRDAAVFHTLQTVVLPELLRTRAQVRVFGAGVSTGEELYSIAMLVAELGELERCTFLGLDCRTDAIEQAKRGEFAPEALARLDPRLQQKYFHRNGAHVIVAPALRTQMEWRVGNLLTLDEPAGWDLILFRNVAIYLDPIHAAAAWTRLNQHLSPGGFLVAGRAEQPPEALALGRVATSIYRRT